MCSGNATSEVIPTKITDALITTLAQTLGTGGTSKNGGFFLTNQTNRLWLAKCLLSSLIYVGISSYIPAVQCCSGVGSHFKVIITASSEIEVKSELRHESPFSGWSLPPSKKAGFPPGLLFGQVGALLVGLSPATIWLPFCTAPILFAILFRQQIICSHRSR